MGGMNRSCCCDPDVCNNNRHNVTLFDSFDDSSGHLPITTANTLAQRKNQWLSGVDPFLFQPLRLVIDGSARIVCDSFPPGGPYSYCGGSMRQQFNVVNESPEVIEFEMNCSLSARSYVIWFAYMQQPGGFLSFISGRFNGTNPPFFQNISSFLLLDSGAINREISSNVIPTGWRFYAEKVSPASWHYTMSILGGSSVDGYHNFYTLIRPFMPICQGPIIRIDFGFDPREQFNGGPIVPFTASEVNAGGARIEDVYFRWG